MEKVIHRAASRGLTDQGWLKTYHTFSFGNYYDPRRIHFGALRILNDNIVEGGEGFSSHPHDNMEIITLPLKGALEHGDSMGNISIIDTGDVQVLTSGTGVIHNEYNQSQDETMEFLQIWVFPEEYELSPVTSKVTYGESERNKLQLIVSPKEEAAGNVAAISQKAWLYLASLDEGTVIDHNLHGDASGAYVFVISGEVEIDDSTLHVRDGIGLWDTLSYKIKALEPSRILVMEIPMKKV